MIRVTLSFVIAIGFTYFLSEIYPSYDGKPDPFEHAASFR